MMPRREWVPCQSSLNRQELKISLPSLADTDACNCHMSSRLWRVHMMSTVLSVYTRPVKTDSKKRAGVHNDVSSPSVAQQSDRPGSWKESEVQRQPSKWTEIQLTQCKHQYLQVGKTKVWTIIHTNNPLKDRTCGPTLAKGTTTTQHKKNCAKKKEANPGDDLQIITKSTLENDLICKNKREVAISRTLWARGEAPAQKTQNQWWPT